MPIVKEYEIVFPQLDNSLSQDKEWVVINYGDDAEKIRLHDYDKIYNIPGLYEGIFYEHLKCQSPETIVGMFEDMLEKAEFNPAKLRVFDFGAGNGMVGERVREAGCNFLVGADILSEAKEATLRDRPEVYDDYLVTDMSALGVQEIAKLKECKFNGLVTVAALGFGDIPPAAFVNAFNLVEEGGWIGFNIKDTFLSDRDRTGYRNIISELIDNNLIIHDSKRYRHRYSTSGEELYYQAIVGKKMKDFVIPSAN
ncbi:MAG: methyltransferase [Chitinivibrionales bacterium]|nr:methyltransferase [Chitinivibrionales bacterium]